MFQLRAMPANRSHDWWTQALHDREAAEKNADIGIYDWACFMGQQAAEKALKALIQHHGGDAWGHSLANLAKLLPSQITIPEDVSAALMALDRFYVPTRYPNGMDAGAPANAYGDEDAKTALRLCDSVLRFIEGHLPRSGAGQ